MKISFFILSITVLMALSCIAQQGGVNIGYSPSASDTVKSAAQTLATELQKANVKNVSVKMISSPAEASVIVGTANELKQIGVAADKYKKLDGLSSESIGIAGNGQQIFLTGNSSLGVQQAVFKYLYLLGFRYYFPQVEWHIYPKKVDLFPVVSIFSKPAFSHRDLWYAYGTGSELLWTRYAFWAKANCLDGELQVNIGHSYDQIVDRNKQVFLQHPEWLSNSTRPDVLPDNPKFDISKPDLIELIKGDTRKQITGYQKNKSQSYKMISLSPSDGIGICNTKDCQKIGSVSDRVFYLINNIAKDIKKDFPGTLIGCLAYSEYITPPSIPVQDNVYVSLTTAFNDSKYSTDELIGLWKKKVKYLGIYDYQALYAWDYDLPGQCLASAFYKIAPDLRKYSKEGLVGYESEINTGWINKGLGYYLSSQLLWDPTVNEKNIIDNFFSDCFQSAAPVVKKMFDEFSRFNDPFVSKGQLARWIDQWIEAKGKEKNPDALRRINIIGNYLRYLALYSTYKSDPSASNLQLLIQTGKEHLNDECVAYYPAMLVLGDKLPGFKVNDILQENIKKPFNYSPEKVYEWLQQFRKALKKPIEYKNAQPSKNLVSIPGGKDYHLSLHDVREDQNSYTGTSYFVFEKKDDKPTYFELQGNFVEGGGTGHPIVISVYPFKGYTVPQEKPVIQYNYTDRKKWNRYPLTSMKKGFYVIKVEDPKKGFQLKLSPEINYSLFMPQDTKLQVGYIHSFYFYVSPGTKSFRLMKSSSLKLIDPSGTEYNYANNKEEEIEITPSSKQSGIWRLMGLAGFFKPEGICPVFGIIPARTLYPETCTQ